MVWFVFYYKKGLSCIPKSSVILHLSENSALLKNYIPTQSSKFLDLRTQKCRHWWLLFHVYPTACLKYPQRAATSQCNSEISTYWTWSSYVLSCHRQVGVWIRFKSINANVSVHMIQSEKHNPFFFFALLLLSVFLLPYTFICFYYARLLGSLFYFWMSN